MNAYTSLIRSARMVHALRPWVLYTCLVLLALNMGVGIFASMRVTQAPDFAGICGFIGGFLWALVGSRLVLIQREMRQMRAARPSSGIGFALMLLIVPTVLLPALVIVLRVGVSWEAMALLVLLNALGLVWALAPGIVGVGFAPYIWLISTQVLKLLPTPTRAPAAVVLAVLVMVYLITIWRAALCKNLDDRWAFGLAPWALRHGDLPGLDGLVSKIAVQRTMQSHDGRAASRARTLQINPANPAQAIGYFLGSMYAPLNRRGDAIGIAMWWLFGLGGVLGAWLLHWSIPGLQLMVMGLAVMLLSPVLVGATLGMRLKASMNTLTELALLPGLGTPHAARKHLLRAMLRRSQLRLALMATTAMLCAFVLGASTDLLAMMLALSALALIGNIVAAVDVWAMRDATSPLLRALKLLAWFVIPQLILIIGFFAVHLMTAAGSGLNRAIILVLGIGWAIAIPALLTRLAFDWRRFQRRPHPFVQR
ncbi:MAG: hypothetical protein ACYCUX_08545 [Metallibacterium sp.]